MGRHRYIHKYIFINTYAHIHTRKKASSTEYCYLIHNLPHEFLEVIDMSCFWDTSFVVLDQYGAIVDPGISRIRPWFFKPRAMNAILALSLVRSSAPSQWETTLLCKDVSHWLGANLEQPVTFKLIKICCTRFVPTSTVIRILIRVHRNMVTAIRVHIKENIKQISSVGWETNKIFIFTTLSVTINRVSWWT